MKPLDWVQFALGTFAAILQQIQALRAHGVPPAQATQALVEVAHAAPGITNEHRDAITAAASRAQSVAESLG